MIIILLTNINHLNYLTNEKENIKLLKNNCRVIHFFMSSAILLSREINILSLTIREELPIQFRTKF